MFHDQSGDKRAEIISLYENANWQDYAIKVHALKSTSLTIGAEALSAHSAHRQSKYHRNHADCRHNTEHTLTQTNLVIGDDIKPFFYHTISPPINMVFRKNSRQAIFSVLLCKGNAGLCFLVCVQQKHCFAMVLPSFWRSLLPPARYHLAA